MIIQANNQNIANNLVSFSNDPTLTQSTSSYNIKNKNVRMVLSSGTTSSINTHINMATLNTVGSHEIEIFNNSGSNYTITTTSLNNFGGSYIIESGNTALFVAKRLLRTDTFDETTHVWFANAGED